MATLEELLEHKARLEEVRGKGITGYSHEGRSMSYRSASEISLQLLEVQKDIDALTTKPVRRILVGTTKGF